MRVYKRTGIYVLEDVRQRCRINDTTGCWEWRGAFSSGTGGADIPVAKNPTLGRVESVARTVFRMTKQGPPKARVWRLCANFTCCAPEHLRTGTAKDYAAWARKQGAYVDSPDLIAKKVAIRRKRSVVMTEELAGWIRESQQRGIDVAHGAGVSENTASRIRRLKQWAPAMPLSSVWGFAANIASYRRAA